MSKNAEHQEAYRKRREADDAWRLNTYLSSAARQAVVTTSIQQGITRKDALEQLIQTGAATMQTQFRRDDPATDPVSTPRIVMPVSQPAPLRKDVSPMTTTNPAPARPSKMTAAEALELDRFKAELPNALISTELDARQVQANGGSAAISQKERVTASFLANNIHRK